MGLCHVCQADAGHYQQYCIEHKSVRDQAARERENAKKRSQYAKRCTGGLCWWCGKEAVNGMVRCPEHRMRAAKDLPCRGCGLTRPPGRSLYCDRCSTQEMWRQRRNAKMKVYRVEHGDKCRVRNRRHCRKRYLRRVEQHICPRCSVSVAELTTVYCVACLAFYRTAQRRKP